jgi:epoxyqueuosine reductase
MSTFHSTISRRDFMRALGLAGAGIGGAMAAAPAFHDLDELLATGGKGPKRAWYVKEVDEPTVEIDWDLMKRHYSYQTQSAALVAQYTGVEKYNAMTKAEKSDDARLKDNEPGYRLKDRALSGAAGGLRLATPEQKFGQITGVKTPADLGVPKWTGTPEEGTMILRAAMVFFGASAIGTAEINEHHKKLIGLTGENPGIQYATSQPPTTATKPMEFSDKPNFSYDSKTAITYLPNVPLYGITYLIMQDNNLNRSRPTVLGRLTQTRYRLREVPRACTQAFITGLGYESMHDEPYRAIPSNAGAVLGGLTENSRHTIMSISPEFGPFGGYFDFLTTLPIAPTKPIDAGIWRMCQNCGLCADYCPSGSIQKKGTEPTWEGPGPSQAGAKVYQLPWQGIRQSGEWAKLGRKTFWTDMPTSQLYQRAVATCNVCWGHCVFAGGNNALIHSVVKGTAATTGLFDSFFSNMHDVFGYNLKKGEDVDRWWTLNLPAYGFDSTVYASDGY